MVFMGVRLQIADQVWGLLDAKKRSFPDGLSKLWAVLSFTATGGSKPRQGLNPERHPSKKYLK
jgi:hypothetical protein